MAQLDLQILQQALQKITRSEKIISDFTPEEADQINLAPDLLTTLIELRELQINSRIGKFISLGEGQEMHSQYRAFRESLPSSDQLGPLINLKPLGCSADLLKKLLERAKNGEDDFLQISLGKVGKELTFLMTIIDKYGNLRPSALDVRQDSGIVAGDEYLDDMRPCPPCE